MNDVARGDSTRSLKQQRIPNAQWMPLEDISRSKLLEYDPGNPGSKVLIGRLNDKLIGIADNRHLTTFASSRAGKSVGLASNLFFYRGSVLVMDPKGEHAMLTAAKRKALGQEIQVLDPFDIVEGIPDAWRSSFNPMDSLKVGEKRFLSDAFQIAESLVVQEAGAKDPHWDESARNFIIACIIHVASDARYHHDRSLIKVRDLIANALDVPQNDDGARRYTLLEEMFQNADDLLKHEETAPIGKALRARAMAFYAKADTERSGVYSTVDRHTEFLDFPQFQSVLRSSNFLLRDLKANPNGVSVYLCFPATEAELAKRWMRLFVNQLLRAMEREKTKPVAPVLFCLDEFAILGYMKQIETAAGLIASFGVTLWTVLQDFNQGKALYRDRWESFIGNAGIVQCFGNTDYATTAYISKLLGKTQVEISRSADVMQEQQTAGLSGRSSSVELYELLTPDEVSRQFSRDDKLQRQLVMWAGKHPMILQRVIHYHPDCPLAKYVR